MIDFLSSERVVMDDTLSFDFENEFEIAKKTYWMSERQLKVKSSQFCGINLVKSLEDSLNPLLSEFKFDKLFFDSTRRKPPKIKEFKAKLVLSQENKIQPSVNLQLNRERSVT